MTTHPITIQLPDELAGRLQNWPGEIPRLLELGLREVEAQGHLEFDGAADVLEFLAGLPSPEEVMALRPSPSLQTRIDALLDKNHTDGLTPDEDEEWRQIEALDHLVRMSKARARQRLNE